MINAKFCDFYITKFPSLSMHALSSFYVLFFLLMQTNVAMAPVITTTINPSMTADVVTLRMMTSEDVSVDIGVSV